MAACCSSPFSDNVRRIIGVIGAVLFWCSAYSVTFCYSIDARASCLVDNMLLPMVMLPANTMGMLTAVFLWVYISFLWMDDTFDSLKAFTYISAVVTCVLHFIAFGLSATKFNDSRCGTLFQISSFVEPLFIALLLTVAFILYGCHRHRLKAEETEEN